MLIIAFDIGIKNMSYCKLSNETLVNLTISKKKKNLNQTDVFKKLSNSKIISWNVEEIVPEFSKTTKNDTILNGLVEFMKRKVLQKLLDDVEVVVIESQMNNAKMKMISESLFTLLRYLRQDIQVFFRHPNYKLDFDATSFNLKLNTRTYNERKKAALALTQAFLQRMNEAEAHIVFLNSHAKKDDLCDSFLHAFRTLMDSQA